MIVTIRPIANLPGQPDDEVSVAGDVLTVNGVEYDMSPLQEGDEARFERETDDEPECPIAGHVRRLGGEIHLHLQFRYATSTAMPDQPQELATVSIASGPLPDPVLRRPPPVVAQEEEV